MGTDAIRLEPADNVATVLRPIEAGQTVAISCAGEHAAIVAAEPIPMCHKISVAPIAQGAPVVKYGQDIGIATVPVAPGRHVHTHNLVSARAKA